MEQAAEFIAPAARVGRVTAGLTLPFRIGAQGATAAAVGMGQGQTPEQAAVTGATAAAGTGIAEGAWPAVKEFLTKKVTSRMLNNLMEVQKPQLATGADPGGQIVKEGIVAGSKDAMLDQVKTKLGDAGKELNAALITKGAGKTIDVEKLSVDAVINATKRIGLGSDPAFQAKLTNVLDDILANVPKGKSLASLTPIEAQALKSEIGRSIKFTGAPFEGDINQVLVKIYRAINVETEAVAPGTKELLSRYSNLTVAKDALKNSIDADKTRSIVSGQGVLANIVKATGTTATKTRAAQAFNPAKSSVVTPGARLVQAAIGSGISESNRQ